MTDSPKARMQTAFARYIRARRKRLQSGTNGALSILTGDLMDAVDASPAAQAAIITFAQNRARTDPKSATILAIAALFDREFPADMDNLLLHFVMECAGLEDHPDSEKIAGLAESVAREGEWGQQIYAFAKGILALSGYRDDE